MTANQITSPTFFEGGKAIFTVSNPKGEHYTFQIKHKKNTPFFVSLLTGPDNISNFTIQQRTEDQDETFFGNNY